MLRGEAIRARAAKGEEEGHATRLVKVSAAEFHASQPKLVRVSYREKSVLWIIAQKSPYAHFARAYVGFTTHLRQARHSEAEGEGDVHDGRRRRDHPCDAGGASDEDQQERAQSFGEQHHQKVQLGDLLQADELLHACEVVKYKQLSRHDLRYKNAGNRINLHYNSLAYIMCVHTIGLTRD